MTPEEFASLKSDLREAQQRISDLRISMAERTGAGRAAAWWGAGMAAMLVAWLGATSLWQIPSLVTATAAGQAKSRAEDAATAAEKASKKVQEMASGTPHLRVKSLTIVDGDNNLVGWFGVPAPNDGTPSLSDVPKKDRVSLALYSSKGKSSIALYEQPTGSFILRSISIEGKEEEWPK